MNYRRTIVSRLPVVSWSFISIFTILTMETISGVADLVSVNENDKSVCKQYHRITATEQVSYIETYWHNDGWGTRFTATRYNFRTKEITKWATIEMCCPGYEPHENAETAEKCVPVCPSNCVNGRCHQPNECTCDEGYHVSINETTKFSECLPSCSSGCQGGSCIEPEICSCDDGYTLANDERSCEPTCFGVNAGGIRGCGEYAACVASDTCKCDDGYAGFKNETTITDQVDGIWSHWNDLIETTTESLDIASKPTFNNSKVVCKPLCDPECGKTASCIKPNECQCNIGYNTTSSPGELVRCTPICEKRCVNGFCINPNECSCNPGYKPHEWLGTTVCEPICQSVCVNAKCTRPNYCKCTDGYENLITVTKGESLISKSVCVPICYGNCQNGKCVAPGQCHCDSGYELRGGDTCVPACPSNCYHGSCEQPNKCVCERHYHESISVWTNYSECLPYCSSGCYGGICIEPEICSCGEGYTLANDERSCEAKCTDVGAGGLKGCGDNALCTEPNSCECDSGYSLHWIDTGELYGGIQFHSNHVVCKPFCNLDCGKTASCIAPNKCQCNTGYTTNSSTEYSFNCIPVCEQNCVNGFCSSPNECTCHEGYKAHQWLGKIVCEPICEDDCINGKCTQPNHCECSAGYEKLSGNVCVPICYGNCPNGICLAPGQCRCNQGYAIIRQSLVDQTTGSIANTDDNSSDSINLTLHDYCQPVCEPGCPSTSICIAPNQCQIQHNIGRIHDGLPRNLTRIIHNTNDCGRGRVAINNDRSVCFYDFNGTKCSESNPCAIIVADNPEMVHKFIFLQSIVFLNNKTEESNGNVTKSENDEKLNWWTPRCTDECRILITSRGFSENLYSQIVNCYELEDYNVTTGLLLDTKALPSTTTGDRNLMCFLKADDIVGSNIGGVIRGIIGTFIAAILIIGLVVLIYFVQQRKRRVSRFNSVSASRGIIMGTEGSQCNTEES